MEQLKNIAESILKIMPDVKYIYVHGDLYKNKHKNIYLVIPDTYKPSMEEYLKLERMLYMKMNIKTYICFQHEKEYLSSKDSPDFVKKVISKGYLIHESGGNAL
ncbi:MAG: hypothetical protein LBI14_11290 [Treponema sp.]|jgi:hypothetical protein|nr:hypothetical protein [Treponema sp.]